MYGGNHDEGEDLLKIEKLTAFLEEICIGNCGQRNVPEAATEVLRHQLSQQSYEESERTKIAYEQLNQILQENGLGIPSPRQRNREQIFINNDNGYRKKWPSMKVCRCCLDAREASVIFLLIHLG